MYSQPVLSAAPVAYWVTTGLKQTSEAAWAGVMLTAEEIAVVIPVQDEVLADAEFPIWDELRDPIGQAFAQKLDAAIFAGTDKPASLAGGDHPRRHRGREHERGRLNA